MGKVIDKIISNDTSNMSGPMCLFVIIAGLLLYMLDFGTLWNGYPLETLSGSLKLLITVMMIIFVVLFITNHFRPFASAALFLYSLWAFIFLAGLATSNLVALVHLLFSMIMFFIFKNKTSDFDNLTRAIFLITFMDFFGFAILKQGALTFGVQKAAVFSRLMIPLWLYYVLGFCQKHNGTALVDWILIIIVIFNLFMIVDMGQLTVFQRTDNLDKSWANQASRGMKQAWAFLSKDLWTNLAQSYHNFNQQVFNQSYLYDGQQEDTEEPQGIYIEKIDRGDYVFKEYAPIYFWALIEARNLDLDNPIYPLITCTVELDDGTLLPGIVNEEDYEYEFEVHSGVDRTISCRYDPGLIPEGGYKVTFDVTFNFGVDARRKIYLMDRTRYTEELVALKRQGKTPTPEQILLSVDITDTLPETIYTSGPVSLGIGTHNPPWDIGDTHNIKYLFGVTFENLWTQGGEIQSIDEIQLIVPDTFEIMLGSCDVKIDYDNPIEEDNSKTYVSTDTIIDIEDFRTVNCLMKVEKDSLDPLKVTTRFLKSHVDYTYSMTESIDFEVEGLSDFEKAAIEKDQVCCKIVTAPGGSSSTEEYRGMSSYECQQEADGQYVFTSEVDPSNCYTDEDLFDKCCAISSTRATNYIWVVDELMCDEYDSHTESAQIIDDTSKCPVR